LFIDNYSVKRKFIYFIDNGACYGWKPSSQEPYKWISYNDVMLL